MPNGGMHHCGGCCHHDANRSLCTLRKVTISSSHWTTCRNRNRQDTEIYGPIFAIVCEVKNGGGSSSDIPYFDEERVDTFQEAGPSTVVRFVDADGSTHVFSSVGEYLDFYKNSGREL